MCCCNVFRADSRNGIHVKLHETTVETLEKSKWVYRELKFSDGTRDEGKGSLKKDFAPRKQIKTWKSSWDGQVQPTDDHHKTIGSKLSPTRLFSRAKNSKTNSITENMTILHVTHDTFNKSIIHFFQWFHNSCLRPPIYHPIIFGKIKISLFMRYRFYTQTSSTRPLSTFLTNFSNSYRKCVLCTWNSIVFHYTFITEQSIIRWHFCYSRTNKRICGQQRFWPLYGIKIISNDSKNILIVLQLLHV